MPHRPLFAALILDPEEANSIYPENLRAEIRRHHRLLPEVICGRNWEAMRPALAEADIVFSGWKCAVWDERFLAALPRLQALFYGAGSIKRLASEAFWESGVRLSSAWSANAVPVAEYTLSQIFFLLKDGYRYATEVRRRRDFVKHWRVPGCVGSVVGLVSLGAVGRLVAERLRQTELRVIAYDPFVDPAEARALGVELVDLERLFATADVVSLHAPRTPETEGMIDADLLRLMPPGARLINTARGQIVNQDDLTEVLQARPDLFAVLDVTWPEPPPKDSPLYDLENVVITPHIAGSMGGECERMGRFAVEESIRFLRGEPLLGEVTRERMPISA